MDEFKLTLSQLRLLTQVCEFSAKMGVLASTDELSKTGAPESAILYLRSFTSYVYVTLEQLAAAKQVLSTIYEANRELFNPNMADYKDSDQEEDFPGQAVPETFYGADVDDALVLGVYATKANLDVFIHTDWERLMFKTHNTNKVYYVPLRALHLARKIFEIVCEMNRNFTSAQNPEQD